MPSLAELITMKIAQNEQKKPKKKGGWFENSVLVWSLKSLDIAQLLLKFKELF